MASTIQGYEGTGRSLSLKLLNQLRQQSSVKTQTECKIKFLTKNIF
jgi:N-acetyltransferase 10